MPLLPPARGIIIIIIIIIIPSAWPDTGNVPLGSLTEVCSAGQDNPTPDTHLRSSSPSCPRMWEFEGTPKLSYRARRRTGLAANIYLLVWEHPLSKHVMRGKKTFQT